MIVLPFVLISSILILFNMIFDSMILNNLFSKLLIFYITNYLISILVESN